MNILEYNGYHGSVELDMERGVVRGKILFIADLVTYETGDLAQLQKEFEAAVADYLGTCEALGREPKKPASGTFNVRTGSEMHRAAQIRAIEDGISMNEVVVRALGCYLSGAREIREKHIEKHFLNPQDFENNSMLISTTGDEPATRSVSHALVQ